jgi:hypothetical protein
MVLLFWAGPPRGTRPRGGGGACRPNAAAAQPRANTSMLVPRASLTKPRAGSLKLHRQRPRSWLNASVGAPRCAAASAAGCCVTLSVRPASFLSAGARGRHSSAAAQHGEGVRQRLLPLRARQPRSTGGAGGAPCGTRAPRNPQPGLLRQLPFCLVRKRAASVPSVTRSAAAAARPQIRCLFAVVAKRGAH